MPSSKVTIRDYFKDETNNELILRCLKYVFDDEELDIILNNINNID